MTDGQRRADDLRTVELDDILNGSAGDEVGGRLGPRARWRLAIGLVISGGALAWLASLLPWMIVREAPFYSDSRLMFSVVLPNPMLTLLARIAQTHGGNISVAIILIAEQAYSALGAFIGGALLSGPRQRLRAAFLLAHAAWLATLLAWLAIILALLAAHDSSPLMDFSPGMRLLGASGAGGFWLAWLAATLSVAGALLARRALGHGAAAALDARSEPSTLDAQWLFRRATAERWGGGLATTGVLIWGCGFFTLPWVTQGCAGLHFALTHFVSGSCAGLAAADALTLSPLARPSVITQSALTSDAFVYLLLAALACWALLQLWMGRGGVRRYGWALAWLALACLVVALAFQGSRVALANPIVLDISITDAWVFGPGLTFALVGLAVAGGGFSWAFAATFASKV